MGLDVDVIVGTCGWSYPDWVGPFYPPGTSSGRMLSYYARIFDAVEVNSSFYAVPPQERVHAWDEATPDGFRFSVKAPRELTHESRLRLDGHGQDALDRFVTALEPLGAKLDRVLVQLPPSLARHEGLSRLEDLLAEDPFEAPVVLEARHASWEHERVFEVLEEHGAAWAWSENDAWTSPPVPVSSEAYVRLIGDRELDTFDRLQRDPEPVIDTWVSRVEENASALREVRVFANNHFAGFGPATANLVLRRWGRPERAWDVPEQEGQATLGEFDGDG